MRVHLPVLESHQGLVGIPEVNHLHDVLVVEYHRVLVVLENAVDTVLNRVPEDGSLDLAIIPQPQLLQLTPRSEHLWLNFRQSMNLLLVDKCLIEAGPHDVPYSDCVV